MNTTNWSVSDVAKYLEKLGLSQYSSVFISNDIDGKTLPYLDNEYMKEMGINSAGHRIILRNFINTIENDEEAFPPGKSFDDSIHPLEQSIHYQLFVAPLNDDATETEMKDDENSPENMIECEICHQKFPQNFYEEHCNQCKAVFEKCKKEYSRRNLNFTDQQILDLMNGKVPENHVKLEKCEFCGRKFNPKSFTKHIEMCKKKHEATKLKEEENRKKKEEKVLKDSQNKNNKFAEAHKQLIKKIKAQKEFSSKIDPKTPLENSELIQNLEKNIKPTSNSQPVTSNPERGQTSSSFNDNKSKLMNSNFRKSDSPNSKGKNQKYQLDLDPSTNPLVQQIIDMGILIREPEVSWDSIAGLSEVKKLLRKQLVFLPMRPDLCKGLLSPWKSVLLYGPPGTGKTFIAKALATECKRTFFNVTSATITSRFHGESEKLVSFLFQLSEQMSPATIFFDEIDSVASQRGTSNEGEASRRMKAQLLTNIEGISSSASNNVFVLAATNFPWDLDEALLRRFQKRVYIPLPDAEGRKTILEMKIKEYADENFDYDGWANKLEGYSCADIANLCRDAAQMVFDRQTDHLEPEEWLGMGENEVKIIITNDDFAKAVAQRKSSVDQASLSKYEAWRRSKGAE
ncbi:hypothetical protein TRFO_36096 [Tritrichomonas foetus]|uniref:Uncharacterized protein n=1 Tax=Tritrichomonas foetus TaxID=1144522 RepID=A0A1J4JJF7_9EUKA|nr:hypothetical protein TRFO_36096 [Tritrichomonas foetus]|eukprot:OHS97667.1 hypothetical protein TRFO_36096 [Tritrichomonas foetus]